MRNYRERRALREVVQKAVEVGISADESFDTRLFGV
jgi:hypothetical protein